MPRLLGCFSSKTSEDPEEDFQPNQAAIDYYRRLYDEAAKRIDQSDKDYQKIKDNLEVQKAQLEVERMKIKGIVHQLEGEEKGENLKSLWKENERLMELIRDKDVEWDKRLDERRKEMKTAELGYYRMREELEKKPRRKGRGTEDHDVPDFSQPIYPKLPRDLTSNPFFTGILTVQILDGQGLKVLSEEIGKSNAMYCVVEVDGVHRGYTSVADNAFRWRETFQIDVISANTIRFLINSWNPHLQHTLCHNGTINLIERIQEIRENKVIELDLEPSGQLIVRLDFRDLNSSFQRTPSTLENRIWGAPIEELQEEEEMTPMVLKRMIEEVEGRGVGLDGLYTMCGAWEIKKPLRDALEIDPIHTSLSRGCIADPHVIASLIKDFLQELPEPLIPQFIHSWLLDASIIRFRSHLEPTRASILKILDGVPKTTKSCLYLVLDHLKRIVEAEGARTQERLALIFAPLIFFKFDTAHVGSGYIDVNQASETLEMILTVWPTKRRV